MKTSKRHRGEKFDLKNPPDDGNSNITVSFHGGALIPSVSLELIFWGNAWTSQQTTPAAIEVVRATQNMLSGPYMSGLDQYGIGSGRLRDNGIIVLSDPPNPFSKDDWHNMIWDLIDQGTYPEPDDDGGRNLYMFILPPGVNYTDPNVGGIHGYPGDYDFPFDYDHAWAGFALNDGTLDTITTRLSHEIVEACTDPEDDGWTIDGRSSPSDEIGDVCQNTTGRVNGVMVQAYWSQRDRACIIPPVLPDDEDLVGAGARVALSHQSSIDQLDALAVNNSGAVVVLWVGGEGNWQGPAQLTAPGFAPPGARIALAHQTSMNQLDALLVDNTGAVSVMWVVGEGAWQGPAQLTGPGFAPPGACIGLSYQSSMNQLDALLVDNHGAVSVMWVAGGGAWQGPVQLTGPGFAAPGGCVTLAHQISMNQLDALLVDNSGAVSVMWTVGEGVWQGPVGLTQPGFAPPGGQIALAHQSSLDQLDALLVDNSGAVQVMWVSGAGAWQGPAQLTGGGFAPAGGSIALSHQTSMDQLDAVLVDNGGAVQVMWVNGEGAWQGPAQLTGGAFALPGASIALAHQASMNQLDALLVDSNGTVSVLWVAGEGIWQGPVGLAGL